MAQDPYYPALYGSDLIQMVIDRLGGYANAFTADAILDFLNEGKDAVWGVLKSLNENFFQVSSNYTDNTQVNYFGPLATGQREYSLPPDFRSMRFIECVTSGYSSVRFRKVNMNTAAFHQQRSAANDPNNNSIASNQYEYLYDIVETQPNSAGGSVSGGFEIVMAAYPSEALQLVLWYIRALPDFEASVALNQTIQPYSKRIVTYAVQIATLVAQDESMSDEWFTRWKDGVVAIAQSAGPVNGADPVFVQDFEG